MRLVADENVPLKAVLLLREKGHDVLSISESLPKTSDEDILKTAERDGRIILSFDKDFGELAFCSELPISCGIILLRIPLLSVDYITSIIVDAVQSRSDWAGHFAVVEPGRIRMREL
jgi:predicted nuclease of predicted toxin-antitoxin system